MPAVCLQTVETILRTERDALAVELAALRRVVRRAWPLVCTAYDEHESPATGMVCNALDPVALRAAGDELGAAAVEAALKGEKP